jgi:hypothetical protein
MLIALAAATWGLARFVDQYLWLGTPGRLDAVEVTGLVMSALGWAAVAYLMATRDRRVVRSPEDRRSRLTDVRTPTREEGSTP